MKSNRLMQVILLILLVVFIGAGAFIYAADSKEKQRYRSQTAEIAQQQVNLTRSLTQKADKEKEATDLAAQLAAAKASVAQINFRLSVESIEYDRILFSLADTSNVTLTNLVASPPTDVNENKTAYQVTSFNISLAGLTPTKMFQTTADSQSYIDSTIKSFQAFIDTLIASPDFDTTVIEVVNINAPEPMTAQDIEAMNSAIDAQERSELKDAEIQDKTEDEIVQLVKEKIAAKNADQIRLILQNVGFIKPTATINIKIWTYKGA